MRDLASGTWLKPGVNGKAQKGDRSACVRRPNSMDPARPTDPDPADPFFPERVDHAVLETIEIATEGEDCGECVRKLRPLLKNIPGVQDVKVDLRPERVIVTFDPRKTHPPDLHDAILKSGYKPAAIAD